MPLLMDETTELQRWQLAIIHARACADLQRKIDCINDQLKVRMYDWERFKLEGERDELQAELERMR